MTKDISENVAAILAWINTGTATVPASDANLADTLESLVAALSSTTLVSPNTLLTGVTAGAVTASKVLTVDSNRDIATIHNITLDGTLTGKVVGTKYDAAAPTAYDDTTSHKAIDPSISAASLTKGSAGTDYTLAVPGANYVNKGIKVYSTGAYAHVVTVTGLLGGTTLTFAAAIGSSFELYAISATAWAVVALNGVTQTA